MVLMGMQRTALTLTFCWTRAGAMLLFNLVTKLTTPFSSSVPSDWLASVLNISCNHVLMELRFISLFHYYSITKLLLKVVCIPKYHTKKKMHFDIAVF